MTDQQQLLNLFRQNRNVLTLGEILRFPFGYEFRARFTELRQKGFVIKCKRNGKQPSLNTYTLAEPESSGQMRLIA